MRTVGTVVRGIRCPIFKKGDDLASQVVDSVLAAAEAEKFPMHDRDVIGITESVVARTQGNYVTVDDIAADIRSKFPGGEVGVIFPILSRNRFSILLKAISRGVKKVHLMLSYPADEVGNHLMDPEKLDDAPVDPRTDVMDEAKYREIFGMDTKHPFTGLDYVEFYKEIIGRDKAVIHFANDPRAILAFTKHVLCADIHTRRRSKKLLLRAGAETVYCLDEICTKSMSAGSGYNERYGLLGSNLSGDEIVKLFPRDCQPLVEKIQSLLKEKTGKTVEVMVYGDGAFKDPVGKIWELADPVVSPGYTAGLKGTPNEIKLKYLADEAVRHGMNDAQVKESILKRITEKSGSLVGKADSLGTTPRQLTDLLGSLMDLTSGSGDKGTPVVLVQGYFDNYAN